MQTSCETLNIVGIGNAALKAVDEALTVNFLPKFSADCPTQWPTLFCKDGYSMSVQASVRHLCRPRVDNATNYTHVEVSCTAEPGEPITAYGDAEEGIYAFVPVEVVMNMLAEHGGLDLEKTAAFRLSLTLPYRMAPAM